MNKTQGTLLAGLIASMITVGCKTAATQSSTSNPTSTTTSYVKCTGDFIAKGQSDCGGHGNTHGCHGKNDCKGKGWKKLTASACKKSGGNVAE